MRTRDEHLEWCKQRALEYVDAGDLGVAVSSMLFDLAAHDETKIVSAWLIRLGKLYLDQGDPVAVRKWVESFR